MAMSCYLLRRNDSYYCTPSKRTSTYLRIHGSIDLGKGVDTVVLEVKLIEW
jgi:hypothetical protein